MIILQIFIIHILTMLILLKHPGQLINLLIFTIIIVYIDSKNKKNTQKKYKYNKYYQSTYFLTTHIDYNNMLNDPGRNGEYSIFQSLQSHENIEGRFLFNCYLYKYNNKTTEIDVILINHYGIFVFESKNYKGWIFGSEDDTYWTQSLKAGRSSRKVKFYNPILQNELHVKTLKNIVGNKIPIYSIIVFSNRCELKSIRTRYTDTEVIKISEINQCVNRIIRENKEILSTEQIIQLYNKLYPYTQVSNTVKQQHIVNIQKNR